MCVCLSWVVGGWVAGWLGGVCGTADSHNVNQRHAISLFYLSAKQLTSNPLWALHNGSCKHCESFVYISLYIHMYGSVSVCVLHTVAVKLMALLKKLIQILSELIAYQWPSLE